MSKRLEISPSKNTPEILGDVDSRTFSIKGNSFPENARKFYAKVNEYVSFYCENCKEVSITCEFNYLASSSLITVLNIIKNFEKHLGSDNCSLEWKYEDDDDDILKIGEDFQKVLEMEMKFTPIN